MALSLRERRLIGAAVLLLLLLLAFLLLRGEEQTSLPPPAAPVASPPPFVPAAPVAPPAPVANLTGLTLHGLLASGAILGFPDGSQRLVPLGREALPGFTLSRIEQNQAVFTSAGGEVRLGFDGPAQAQAAAPLVVSTGQAGEREEGLRYRLGLAPRTRNGRVTGYTLRPGADLPALARAGIHPGDTIVGVNGASFDEERMLELSWTIANSSRVEFEIERGGRRVRVASESR